MSTDSACAAIGSMLHSSEFALFLNPPFDTRSIGLYERFIGIFDSTPRCKVLTAILPVGARFRAHGTLLRTLLSRSDSRSKILLLMEPVWYDMVARDGTGVAESRGGSQHFLTAVVVLSKSPERLASVAGLLGAEGYDSAVEIVDAGLF